MVQSFMDITPQLTNAKRYFPKTDIPPRPRIITEILQLLEQDSASFGKIACLVRSDPALAGSVLLIVNSAYFGLSQKVVTVAQAIGLLGVQNIKNLVMASAMRNAMTDSADPFLTEFWVTSSEIAHFAAFIAREHTTIPYEEAFTAALFHNAGLPLMHKRFARFEQKYVAGLKLTARSVVELEDVQFGTNHCEVGALLASKWQLPEQIRIAILCHHRVPHYLAHPHIDPDTKRLLSIIKLAEYLCYQFHPNFDYINLGEWSAISNLVLDQLSISTDMLRNITATLKQLRECNGAS